MEITMFLLDKESKNQPLSIANCYGPPGAPRRSLEAPIESAGGEECEESTSKFQING